MKPKTIEEFLANVAHLPKTIEEALADCEEPYCFGGSIDLEHLGSAECDTCSGTGYACGVRPTEEEELFLSIVQLVQKLIEKSAEDVQVARRAKQVGQCCARALQAVIDQDGITNPTTLAKLGQIVKGQLMAADASALLERYKS